jgi:hypothetical protein
MTSGSTRCDSSLRAALAWLLAGLMLAACGGGDLTEEAVSADESRAPLAARAAAPVVPPVEVQLQALADDIDVPNPERGFYRWAALDMDTLTTPAAVAVFEADAQAGYNSGYRILYARIRLDAWRGVSQLPTSMLDAVRAGFGAARRSGIKLIPRFVYNDGPLPGESLGLDAPLPVVLAHLGQLKKQKVLDANADAIAFLQAGFIGAWGEWHSSSNQLDELAPMTKIRDALFAALPADQFVQFRNPHHLIAFYPSPPTAQTSGNQARTGFHNDCFLSSDTDVGSYSSDPALREQQRAHMAAIGKIAPFGAETCWPPEPAQARMTCADIEAEGKQFALTYLNEMFYQPFMDGWRAEGCFDRVKASMGYRLRLKDASYPGSAARGRSFVLRFTVDNAGWARVYKPHGVRLVLRGRESGFVASATMKGLDARRWIPGDATPPAYAESASLKLPKQAPPGIYDVCLGLPDTRLPQDARFAIRPANADNESLGQGWDAALGAFCVGGVTVN